jgi:hypothetical protein
MYDAWFLSLARLCTTMHGVLCGGQVMALSEELEAMQTAWADRDARQRKQDEEMKDMAFQV